MKSVLFSMAAIGLSIAPLSLAAQELFSVAHPSITGDSVGQVYSYLNAEDAERMRALFPGNVGFRPGIVRVVEIVDAKDIIFHPGAILVVDRKIADYLKERMAGMGTPEALTITQIAE